MSLFYDYIASKAYCDQIGLVWLGDEFPLLMEADKSAHKFGLSQEVVDELMRHHLWQVKFLFNPKNYLWYQRLALALHFITGWKGKKNA